jgi:hypothetical protein
MSAPYNQLVKGITENSLTQNEKDKLIKLLTKSEKKKVIFSAATLENCQEPGGLGLNTVYVTKPVVSLFIPDTIPYLLPTEHLCSQLSKLYQHFDMRSEKACRMVIDAILLEILDSNINEKLHCYCEVKLDWDGSEIAFRGSADYLLGSADVTDSCLLVVEAKKEWPANAVGQVISEAGCLLKKRQESRVAQMSPVFVVLSNGEYFKFFVIDIDGMVYTSGRTALVLAPSETGTFSPDNESLKAILRWFYWFITAIKRASPRSSASDLQNIQIDRHLSELRKCFGPRL